MTDRRLYQKQPRVPLVAWLNPRHYSLERWAYTLQRVTGMGLLLYFVGHIVEVGTVTGGPDSWAETLAFTQTPMGHVILIVAGGAIFFHGLNGIRLILVETGYLLGKPRHPEYPYRPVSFNRGQRSLFWLSVAMVGLAMVYAWLVLFGGLPG